MTTHDWNVQDCINQLSPWSGGSKSNIQKPHRPMTNSEVSFVDIQTAYDYIASIVARHGKAYLPLFERIHKEMEDVQKEVQLLELAFDVSSAKLSTEENELKTPKNISHIFSHVTHTMKIY